MKVYVGYREEELEVGNLIHKLEQNAATDTLKKHTLLKREI